jgi:tRNA nucleotidyltransferase (CCA-adding enzyme)
MEGFTGVSQTRLDEETKYIVEKLREKGQAWVVGGWIRNLILGISPGDVDIATNLIPEEILDIFPKSIMTGEKFGTVRVRTDTGSKEIEVTTLRSDGIYTDNRRPENVVFGVNIEDDIARRDFTINAMALDKNDVLIDEYNGVSDLENNILRCVGIAEERIREDGLRILRAFRFIGLKDNQIMSFDHDLENAIINNADVLNNISKERINEELRKILQLNNREIVLQKMHKLGVLQIIFDNLETDFEVILSDDYIVNIALIFNLYKKDGNSLSEFIRDKLKISRKEKDMIGFLHDNGVLIPSSENIFEMRRFRASLSEEQKKSLFKYLKGMRIETEEVEKAIEELSPLKVGHEPLVNGKMLIAETGLKPEMKLGRLKGWLHRKQIEMDLDNIEDVLELLNDIDWENSNPEEWLSLSWP